MEEKEKRKIKKIYYSRKFLKSLGKLPNHIIKLAFQKEAIFKNNVFDSTLNTLKLHGKEKDIWSFNINYSYRIKFIFLADEEILFLEAGTHKIYK